MDLAKPGSIIHETVVVDVPPDDRVVPLNYLYSL